MSPIDRRLGSQPGWSELRAIEIYQMACETSNIDEYDQPSARLGEADALDMYALAKATDPGPFEIKTHLMGTYFGVRSGNGELNAMAGERMRLPGWVEVSGVCTNEKARGLGLASKLVAQVMRPILSPAVKLSCM